MFALYAHRYIVVTYWMYCELYVRRKEIIDMNKDKET